MAYLYRHIRLDKNIPFYIGIGNDSNGKYIRAYFKSNRSNHWKRVVDKGGYDVEILMDGISWEFACEKEKEFIKLYGRLDLGLGQLVNKTDGGEGCVNGITPATREKMAAKLRGRPLSDKMKKVLIDAHIGLFPTWSYQPIYQFDLRGNLIKEYASITEAGKELKLQNGNIYKAIVGSRPHCGGYFFEYKTDNYSETIININRKVLNGISPQKRKVKNIASGVIYNSLKEAAVKENIHYGTFKNSLRRKGVYKNIIYLK